MRFWKIPTDIIKISWSTCIIVGFVVGAASFFLDLPSSSDRIFYLLSAISQALATIFALVFTITITFATMSKKYSAVELILNDKTKILMLIFFIGIVLPLLILKMDINELPIKDCCVISGSTIFNILTSSAIGIAAFCVISIIPYLKSTDNITKFTIETDNLIDELSELENYSKATRIVTELSDLAKSAIKERMKDPVIKINNALSDFIREALSKQEDKSHNLSPYLLIRLHSTIAIDATIAKMDNVVYHINSELLKSGKILIDENVLDGAVGEIISTFNQIGITAVEKRLKNTLSSSLVRLLQMYKATSNNQNFEPDSERANIDFWMCAAHLLKDWPEQENLISIAINSVGLDINNALPKKSRDYLKTQYSDLFELLEKFMKSHTSDKM